VPLATLEIVNEGPDKGKTLEVRGPLTNIGRGDHNDLVLTSETVSDSHAKLQKRDNGWYIVDIGSTNGTYVGGRRVQGDFMLTGAPDLRFGDVKVAFRPSAAASEQQDKGTRAIAGVSVEEARRAAAARKPATAQPATTPAEPEPKRGAPWIWIGVALGVVAAAAYFFLLGS
jgi:pSer/pThr/pTyr-binding forkhead associated (FHA) protein